MTSFFQLSEEEREAIMEANPPEIGAIYHANVGFSWMWRGCGFGEFSVAFNRNNGEITASNECMGRESTRKFLHALADYIADRVVLLDNPEDVPPVNAKVEFEKTQKFWEDLERKMEDGR